MKNSNQQLEALGVAYKRRHDEVLVRIENAVGTHISECIKGQPRIDRISARAKGVDRFLKKASTLLDGKSKYAEPLVQIQDQIGARIVVFYKSDVDRVDAHVRK